MFRFHYNDFRCGQFGVRVKNRIPLNDVPHAVGAYQCFDAPAIAGKGIGRVTHGLARNGLFIGFQAFQIPSAQQRFVVNMVLRMAANQGKQPEKHYKYTVYFHKGLKMH